MVDFTRTEHLDGKVTLYGGDNRDVLKSLPDNSIDSIVTDPPYALVSIVKRFGNEQSHLEVSEKKDLSTIAAAQYKRLSGGFMGAKWDTGEVAFSEVFWAEVLRVLKPGGHVVAFSGTRTYHRMAVAIEDAGFEIRDQLAWMYGSGFPKSHDVRKGIDKAAGAVREVLSVRDAAKVSFDPEGQGGGGWSAGVVNITAPSTDAARQWQGWGTALKPAWEPICLARKPLISTVAANVLEHGTGALNIDGCRVGTTKNVPASPKKVAASTHTVSLPGGKMTDDGFNPNIGRWPANIVISYPNDEYQIKPYVTQEQMREIYGWLHENA